VSDETLVAEDIRVEATENGLINPFFEHHLRGASYDLAAGSSLIIVRPESEGGLLWIDLEGQNTWSIPPGRTAILKTLEKVSVPLNMKGRLSLRAWVAAKLLTSPGGQIDPGYRGYLFLPLVNLGDVPITITYGETIVTAEFVRLSRNTTPYSDLQFDSIPQDRLPDAPATAVYSVETMSTLVDKLTAQIGKLERAQELQQPMIDATARVADFAVLGAVAGTVAGAIGGGIVAVFTQMPEPWNVAVGLGIIGAGAAAAFWLRNYIPHVFTARQVPG
jgi:deoxycytidine triphosphate deaminase